MIYNKNFWAITTSFFHPKTILEFAKDKNIICEVYAESQIKFRDKITSLSDAAFIILKEMRYDWKALQGPRWWLYKGTSLSDLRDERK